MVDQIKKRRITQKDWDKVAEYVKQQLTQRENDSFRKKHERVWKEVDRQVAMEPMNVYKKDKNDNSDWHNVMELGELARASEIITADVMRLLFPNNRSWFEVHSSVEQPNNKPYDKAIRAFMVQQQSDFGFKERINLSVHEALHHGGFVVEVDEETALKIHDGTGVQALKAPVWKPHSMWNCYPDPSPSVLATNTFYNGSMIIKEYMPLHVLREMKGSGWVVSQISKVKKKQNKNKDVETQDIEIIKYFGDVVIPRQGSDDIVLPNSEVYLANDTFVYFSPSKLPFPRIIYNGYERMDVRDPYYISPIVKTAPLHKMATKLANKTLDSVDLHIEPPIVYEANDPAFVASGGPVLAPGAKSPTKGLANYKELPVGDPDKALSALMFVIDQIRQSTSVDAARAGAGEPVERTATAVRRQAQRGEVRVVDFVDKLDFSLKTFLYMQHEFNKNGLDKYTYYNPEMDADDFNVITREDIPSSVHFEIVGSKGVLGEEERAQKMLGVTTMAAGSELFAPLLKPDAILKQAFMDAGIKNPEQFINVGENDEINAIAQRIQQEAQAVISQYEQQIFEMQKDLAIQRAVNGARVEEARIKAESQAEVSEFKADLQAKLDILDAQLKLIEANADNENEKAQTQVTIREIIQAVNDIQDNIDEQNSAIDKVVKEMGESVEKRLEKTDGDLKALMDKANRPMSERIKDIKKALKEAGNA